jgi:hypothetical protein
MKQVIGRCSTCNRPAHKLADLERECGKKGCQGRIRYVEVEPIEREPQWPKV